MNDKNSKQVTKIDLHDKNDYYFILKHDILPVVDICLVARNISLGDFLEKMKYTLHLFCPIKSLILSGIKCGKIKHTTEFNASPLESLLYLKEKGIQLPENLVKAIDCWVISLQNSHEMKKPRTKESYQTLEIRKHEPGLIAVLKTLLDLYPGLPKETLIYLKPVQKYAKGNLRSSAALCDLITEIEGKNRPGGNKNQEKIQQIEKMIPDDWREKSSSQ